MRNYQLKMEEGLAVFRASISYPASISIDKIINQCNIKAKTLKVELESHFKPVKFKKDCFLVETLQKCYEEVTGLDGTPVTTTGGTYAKIMPNIVPFGPSFPGQKGIGHNPNEWMSIEDIITNAKIYALSLYELAK
ncbi:Beta-Ala-Xaa dipeptidase [bioreactor metagenome]